MSEPVQAVNTDRQLWREREGDYYADSIHVTADGGIGMDCGGHVIVLPIREWHARANRDGQTQFVVGLRKELDHLRARVAELEGVLFKLDMLFDFGAPVEGCPCFLDVSNLAIVFAQAHAVLAPANSDAGRTQG